MAHELRRQGRNGIYIPLYQRILDQAGQRVTLYRRWKGVSKMENKAEVLWINRINERLALADADDLSMFYAFISAYQEEAKKKKQQ